MLYFMLRNQYNIKWYNKITTKKSNNRPVSIASGYDDLLSVGSVVSSLKLSACFSNRFNRRPISFGY